MHHAQQPAFFQCFEVTGMVMVADKQVWIAEHAHWLDRSELTHRPISTTLWRRPANIPLTPAHKGSTAGDRSEKCLFDDYRSHHRTL